MNLEFGFLVSYDWMEALRSLGGEDFKALLLALIDRQRDGVELPRFENPMVRVFASMIEPTIVRRLKGSEYGKRKGRTQNKDESLPEATHEDTYEDTHEDIHEDTPQGTLQPSKAKQSKAERTLAKRSLAEHSGAEGAHVRVIREETPSYAPQEETPSYAPQEETPSYAPREETPSYAPQEETPSYAPREETPSYAPREETPSLDLQAAPQVAPRQPPAPALREEREEVVFVEQKTPPMHQGDTSEALAFSAITPRRTPEPASAARIRSRSRTGFPSHREPLRQSPASSRHSDRSSAQFRSSA